VWRCANLTMHRGVNGFCPRQGFVDAVALSSDIPQRLVVSASQMRWGNSHTADADHSLALLRVAAPGMTREKVCYGCTQEPAPAVGLMLGSADNGSAIRPSVLADAYPCRAHRGTGMYRAARYVLGMMESVILISRTYRRVSRADAVFSRRQFRQPGNAMPGRLRASSAPC